MTISYPKEMRADAKASDGNLLTIDIPGMSYQTGAATKEHVSMMLRVWNWIHNPKRGFKRIDVVNENDGGQAIYVDGTLAGEEPISFYAVDIVEAADGQPVIITQHNVELLFDAFPQKLDDALATEKSEATQ